MFDPETGVDPCIARAVHDFILFKALQIKIYLNVKLRGGRCQCHTMCLDLGLDAIVLLFMGGK
jgi:hypothetical protein